VSKEVVEWDLEDPSGKPMERVREIRDRIREKVQQFVQRIN
jgi:protein-tyrosine-phosphatase